MNADNIRNLTAYRWRALTNSLVIPDGSRNVKYLLAVLEVLAKFGDGRALAAVQDAARFERSGEVHDAAKACLTVLTERVERRKAGSELLRPGGLAIIPEEMLRPVFEYFADDTAVDQLVRPDSGEPK
jgi:hypothetical protein